MTDRIWRITSWTIGFCMALSFYSHGETIDRIVAVVENHIITRSDVRQEREIRARLGEAPLDEDRTLIRQMIENRLIETQIADSQDVAVTDAEIEAELKGSNESSEALRQAVRRRIRMGKYFDLRFRRFIRPTDEEARKYYNEVFVPAARARGTVPIPPLEEVADLVLRNIVEERLSHEVDIWLEAIRRRSHIEVFE